MARIAIIEDSLTDTAVFTDMLRRNGHHVISAGSAEEGVEMVRRELPELVLMDVILPGMNGFQATRAITHDEATRHIPVIICTTKGQETDKVWGIRQGAKDYVVKPVDAAELLGKITALG